MAYASNAVRHCPYPSLEIVLYPGNHEFRVQKFPEKNTSAKCILVHGTTVTM